jgi:catechol 2,3-dioxygenase-like lactoylglutathione lyase family enzyme
MRRIHIGLNVKDLDASVQFYSELFGAEPSVLKGDYAKWMLEDPRVNFSLTSRCGIEHSVHFGIQVESKDELSDTAGRLRRAGRQVVNEPGAICCYHRSDKAWAARKDRFSPSWGTAAASGPETRRSRRSDAEISIRSPIPAKTIRLSISW